MFDRIPVTDLVPLTAMVDRYLKDGTISDARLSGGQRCVPWAATICTETSTGRDAEALSGVWGLEGTLLEVGIVSSDTVISSMISAYVQLGALDDYIGFFIFLMMMWMSPSTS